MSRKYSEDSTYKTSGSIKSRQVNQPVYSVTGGNGAQVATARKAVEINPRLNVQSVAAAAGAMVSLGLAKGYDLELASSTFFALQYDLIAAAGGGINKVLTCPQWYWDLRDALSPKKIYHNRGNYSYKFDTTQVDPINASSYSNFIVAGPSTTTSFGLLQLTVVTSPPNGEEAIYNIISNFFAFMGDERYSVDQRDASGLKDASAFAYKVAATTSMEYTIDDQPGVAVALLEVPFTLLWFHGGFANGDGRLGKWSMHSTAGAAAATTMAYLYRRQGYYPVKTLAAFKPVSFDNIAFSFFAMIQTAKSGYVGRGFSDWPFDGADGVSIVIYLLQCVAAIFAQDMAASIGVKYPATGINIGTNMWTPQASSYQLPAYHAEALKSLTMSLRPLRTMFIPLLTVTPTLIGALATAFPDYNWTEWGGVSLNLSVSQINSIFVRVSPGGDTALGDALSVVVESINQQKATLLPQTALGFNVFSLMTYVKVLRQVNTQVASGYRERLLKKLKVKKAIWPESMDITTNPLNTTVAATYTQGEFKADFLLDQTLVLPYVDEAVVGKLQAYCLYDCGSFLDGENGASEAQFITASSSNYVGDPNNSNKSEQLTALEQRQNNQIGGAATELFGDDNKIAQQIDNLIDSGGVAFKAINWVAAKVIRAIKGKRKGKQTMTV